METERHKEPESKGRQDHRHMQRDSETEREKERQQHEVMRERAQGGKIATEIQRRRDKEVE